MLNIASFITPLAVRPDPNGAAANLVNAEHNWANERQQKAQLGEESRHSQVEEGLQTRGQDFREKESKRDFDEHVKELHTELIRRGMEYADKEGLDKARKLYGPIWESAGIGVDFGDTPQPDTKSMTAPMQPGTAAPPMSEEDQAMADLEEQQKKRGDLSEYAPDAATKGSTGPKPGESLTAWVARNTATKAPHAANSAPAEEKSETPVEKATEGPEATEKDESAAAVEGAPRPWRIYNKATGESYGIIDPNGLDRINRDRATERSKAYTTGTPEPGKPIVEGFTGSARNPTEVELGMSHAERAISEVDKNNRVRENHKGGGPGQIGGAIDEKLLNQVNTQVRGYVSKAVDNSGVKALNTKAQDSARISGMITSGSSGAERQAFATQLHANFGAASSEGERAFQLEQAGVIQSLLAKVDAWAQSGQLPEGLKNEINTVARMQQEFARKYADAIREKATKDAMDSPALGGLYDRALGHPLSTEERDKISAGVKNLGGVEGSDAAEAGSADHEFDKLGL